MSSITPLSPQDLAFLLPFLPPTRPSPISTLPFITLTYACSLDGMISLGPGLRTNLSGPETKSMTHYLRLQHDAILVGAGTAIADKPSLNCRYPGAGLEYQPRPVVVDPTCRWRPEGTPVCGLVVEGKGKVPIVVCGRGVGADEGARTEGGLVERLVMDGKAGERAFGWRDVFQRLGDQGIKSVMVEGGANVINSLLAEPDLVDAMIVTIAPTWLGQGGVTACPAGVTSDGQRVNAARLKNTAWRQFGADAVLCGRLGG